MLGADYYNRRFVELGFENSRISHRLSTANSAEQTTLLFFFENTDTILSIASQTNAPLKRLLGIEEFHTSIQWQRKGSFRF